MAQRLVKPNTSVEVEKKEVIRVEENHADKFRVQAVLAGFARLGKK
jgi:hypothetical protein